MLAWLKNFETRKMKHGRAGLGIFNSTHWGQYSILSTQLCTSKTSFYFQGAYNPARRPTNPSDSYYWCPGLEPQQAPFHMEILCARQHPDFHLGQSLTSFTPLLRCDLSGMSLSSSPSPNPGNHLFFLPFLVSLMLPLPWSFDDCLLLHSSISHGWDASWWNRGFCLPLTGSLLSTPGSTWSTQGTVESHEKWVAEGALGRWRLQCASEETCPGSLCDKKKLWDFNLLSFPCLRRPRRTILTTSTQLSRYPWHCLPKSLSV